MPGEVKDPLTLNSLPPECDYAAEKTVPCTCIGRRRTAARGVTVRRSTVTDKLWVRASCASGMWISFLFYTLLLSTTSSNYIILRPPAGRQYHMLISQQPLNRSLPNFQQVLLMLNEGKVEKKI